MSAKSLSFWLGLLTMGCVTMPEQALAMKLSAEAPTPRLGLKTSFFEQEEAPTIRVALDAEVPVSEQDSTEELEAASIYRQGLYLSSQGQFQEAQARFEQLVQKYPTTKAATSAQWQLEQLKAVLTAPQKGEGAGIGMQVPPLVAGGATTPSAPKHSSGKAEMLVSQSLLGGCALTVLANALNMDLNTGYVAMQLLGLGLGLGAGQLYSTQVPVTSAQAQFIWQTQTFVSYNTLLWKLAIEASSGGYSYPGYSAGATLLGFGLGTALGYGLSPQLPLTEGQVAAGFSAGAWAPGLASALLVASADTDLFAALNLLPITSAIASELATVGAFTLMLSRDFQISRGRVRLINLGGLIGLASAAAVIVARGDSEFFTGGVAFLGMGGGLALGFAATQDWDKNSSVAGLPISSMPSLVAVENGKLALGSPFPQLAQAVRERGKGENRTKEVGTQVQVGLLSGQF